MPRIEEKAKGAILLNSTACQVTQLQLHLKIILDGWEPVGLLKDFTYQQPRNVKDF